MPVQSSSPVKSLPDSDRSQPHDQHHAAGGPENKAKTIAGWAASGAIIALILAFGLDLSARLWMRADNYAQTNTSWAWWVAKSVNESPRPDIAICGSSLMVATVVDTDATFLNKVLDQVVYHRSKYLEHLIQERTGKQLRTQSLAIGGQMASDAFALSTVLLTGNHKPEYLVWGIAPRDFVDGNFDRPAGTDTAKYMRKVADGKDVLGLRTSVNERLDDFFAMCLYLYRHRDQALVVQDNICRNILYSLGWKEPSFENLPKALKYFVVEHCAENEPTNKWNVAPFTKGAPFTDNSMEYVARYNPFHPKIYSAQLRFYEKMMDWCQKNNVRLILINMPITKANEDLMPGDMYAQYLKDTTSIAAKHKVEYVDLNKRGLFPDDDFRDTVHMNGKGGLEFWKQFVAHWPSSATP